MKRDLYIDAVKGIAALSVIFIHTAYWSGVSYVPNFIRVISLFIDVPIFFLVSGLTSSGKIKKNIIRLVKLQITYMIFISTVFIYISISNHNFNITTLLNWYIHNYSDSSPLQVVMGSMWYMEIYFYVIPLGVLILKFCPEKLIKYITIISFIGIIYLFFYPGMPTISYIVFYLFIFLVGHLFKKINLKKLFIIIGACLLIGIYFIFNISFSNLHNGVKFPPNLIYLYFSSFSLFTILSLNGKVKISKPNFLSKIGTNAIFFYFAQGIGASLIYIPVKLLDEKLPWEILLPVMFITNLILTIIFVKVVKTIDSIGWKCIYSVKKIKF